VTATALRTSLIWHDEVMEDIVLDRPRKITLGRSRKSTFVVPDIGLPAEFVVVRPKDHGYYELTLGPRMRGTICVDGRERDVGELVAGGDDGGGDGDGDSDGGGKGKSKGKGKGKGKGDADFKATPISKGDWGVIHLDESGDYKLFFQFVPVEEPPQFFTRPVLFGGLGGYVLASAGLSLMWWLNDQPLDEAIFRGVGMTTIVLALAAGAWWAYRQDNEQKASLVFSIVLHLALLFTTYRLYNGENPFVWPGGRDLTASYLVTRLEPKPPPEPEQPLAVGPASKEEAAAANPNPQNVKTATKGDEGASGGKGETERARVPNAKDTPPNPPKVGFFTDRNRKYLDNIIDRDLKTSMGKFAGIEGTLKQGSMGYGAGTGTGVGDALGGTGTTRGSKKGGPGGGGNVEGDFVTNKGPIDTGTQRPGGTCVGPNCKGAGPREVKVAVGEMSGDSGGLTAEEINRTVKARGGVFRACYQKELNRSPGIAGKLVVKFKIDGSGVVQAASVTGGSTLSNAAVGECVTSNVMRLRFRAAGGAANVTFPFVFSPGG